VLFKVLTVTCLDPLALLRFALGSLDLQTRAGKQRNLELALVQQEIGMVRMTQIPAETRIRAPRIKRLSVTSLFTR